MTESVRWNTLGTGGERCFARRPYSPGMESTLKCWQWTQAITMCMQNKPTEMHSSLGIRRSSCTLRYNKSQIYPLQSVLHFFKNIPP